jgi:hypothetical protein
MVALTLVREDEMLHAVVVDGVGCVLAFNTAPCNAGPKYPYSCLYSSIKSGGFLTFFKTGATTFIKSCFIWSEAILSIFEVIDPCRYVSIRAPINFNFGIIKILITSAPSSDRPSNAPYSDDKGTLSLCCSAFVNIRVILVCMLFVLVLKFLQIWDINRDAKSRSAQWLSSSGLMHNCFDTIHVVTDGINSCN